MAEVLALLERQDAVTEFLDLPQRAATMAPWPTWVSSELSSAYQKVGLNRPWLHQVTAMEHIHSGAPTVLATPTGSGKTLCYLVPVLQANLEAPKQHNTIYLAPTKALAQDQSEKINEVLTNLGSSIYFSATACDGDTELNERKWIQRNATFLLTNPDFLHHSLLPGHQAWGPFLSRVSYLIVDEAHTYKGLRGAHLALIIRRLRRLIAFYRAKVSGNAELTFVTASATQSNEKETAATLFGINPDTVQVIREGTDAKGAKRVVFWEPGMIKPEQRRSPINEAALLLTHFLRAGVQTLAFTKSRRGAEELALKTQEDLPAEAKSLVASYRGGYLKSERRELERQLRSGELLALASTNALESGIDVPGLDVVVIVGWPGSLASLWQQAGRAGRGGEPSLVIIILRPEPLDAYFAQHIEDIFDVAHEVGASDISNHAVLAPHLCAAAQEVPLQLSDLPLFAADAQTPAVDASAEIFEVLQKLVAQGTLVERPTGWFWPFAERASSFVDISGSNTTEITIVDQDSGQVLGTYSTSNADASLHEGAIYIHQGQRFVVKQYNWSDGEAWVCPTSEQVTTWPLSERGVQILETTRVAAPQDCAGFSGAFQWFFGNTEISSTVVGYQKFALGDNSFLGLFDISLPARSLVSQSTWVTFDPEFLFSLGIEAKDFPGTLHAFEHACIALLPWLAQCDRWDLGGLSTVLHPQTLLPTVFVHDAFWGGAGFARSGFNNWGAWLRATLEAVSACACSEGCLKCVYSPKCGNGNDPIFKAGAIKLLRALVSVLT